MKVLVQCARGVQVAYFTLHHTGCKLVSPSTWAKRVPKECAPTPRNKHRPYLGLKNELFGHLVQPQPPTFSGLQAAKSLNETPRPLYQWSPGGARPAISSEQRVGEGPRGEICFQR